MIRFVIDCQVPEGASRANRHEVGVSVIRIGRALIGAKHYLSHGAFLHWLSSEIGIPVQDAESGRKRQMSLAASESGIAVGGFTHTRQ